MNNNTTASPTANRGTTDSQSRLWTNDAVNRVSHPYLVSLSCSFPDFSFVSCRLIRFTMHQFRLLIRLPSFSTLPLKTQKSKKSFASYSTNPRIYYGKMYGKYWSLIITSHSWRLNLRDERRRKRYAISMSSMC